MSHRLPPIDVTLPPATTSPWRARAFVTEALPEAESDLVADVALLVSEMVTNAVLHAHSEVHLSVDSTDAGIRVEVSDCVRSAPVIRNFSDEAATGRGMHLVEEIADRWGTEPRRDGKCVWFEVSPRS
jgi:anti-sigma regulatory factor (Ser/Thr protein kinase)